MQTSYVMVLTPAGAGAIAVIRLTGGLVPQFLERHFSRPVWQGRPVHGEIIDAGGTVDDAVVVVHGGGLTADISVHGGLWVTGKVLELARREGFEPLPWCAGGADERPVAALPARYLDADDEIEREMLAWLPYARTELALRVLLAQPRAWRGFLSGPAPTAAEIQRVLADNALVHLLNPPRVVIIGVPNAGKSTLANRLIGRQRSITADMPGTTRDWVGELADAGGLAVVLVDTPGIRQTDDPLEQAALEHSAGEIGRADMVVLVLDASVPLAGQQQSLVAAFPGALRVVNKTDMPPLWDWRAVEALPVVATHGRGIEELRLAIVRRFGCENPAIDRPRCWTQRQRELLCRMAEEAQRDRGG